MVEKETRQQLWRSMGRILHKEAELAETYDMPLSPPPSKKDRGKEKTVIDKVGSLQPHVDVSGLEPPGEVKQASVSRFAMPSQQRYPLDSYAQVKQAEAYFMENFGLLPPRDRHEYCENLVGRAGELAIGVSPLIEKYGSSTYATAEQVGIAIDGRRSILKDPEHVELLDKLAHIRVHTPPQVFADSLAEFDKLAGIDEYYGQDIPDPYYSTFGKTAEKQESETSPEGAVVVGNEYVTQRKLVEFSKRGSGIISKRFGEDFQKEFTQDPVGILKSLPRDQQLVIMRLANTDEVVGVTAPYGG